MPAAERDPRERLRRVDSEEPLRAERHGVRVEVGAVVREQDARCDDGACGIRVAAKAGRLSQRSAGVDDDRSQPQGLLDHRRDVGAVAFGEVAAKAVHRGRVMEEEIKRPRQRGRGGVVAGEDHREQVVEDLVVLELVAVAVGEQQEREDVGAHVEIRRLRRWAISSESAASTFARSRWKRAHGL